MNQPSSMPSHGQGSVASAVVLRRRGRAPRQAEPEPVASREARRCAAAILEVLAGVRTPTEAAAALGIAVPRYYLWEQRALAGLLAACEPCPVGKGTGPRWQIARLEKEVARLRQECGRQQALARAAQRTIGLSPPVCKPSVKPSVEADGKPSNSGKAKKARSRRPMVRALKAAAAIRPNPDEPQDASISSGAISAEVLQRSPAGTTPAPPSGAADSSHVHGGS